MIRGVEFIGIGVTDIDKSLNFYRDILGLEVLFDYSGVLPGMDLVLGEAGVSTRIVMLRGDSTSPMSSGLIKLVQVLPPPTKLNLGSLPLMPCGGILGSTRLLLVLEISIKYTMK